MCETDNKTFSEKERKKTFFSLYTYKYIYINLFFYEYNQKYIDSQLISTI